VAILTLPPFQLDNEQRSRIADCLRKEGITLTDVFWPAFRSVDFLRGSRLPAAPATIWTVTVCCRGLRNA
jgi:hypothetical protein